MDPAATGAAAPVFEGLSTSCAVVVVVVVVADAEDDSNGDDDDVDAAERQLRSQPASRKNDIIRLLTHKNLPAGRSGAIFPRRRYDGRYRIPRSHP